MDDKELITLSSNNYLGLTTRPRLHAAVVVADYGVGSVRMIASTMTLHEQFEAMLAASKHVEATLTFQSGYATNLGVLYSLLTECDVVFSDELNHASIIDRVRLTEATRMIFPHKDLDTLETGLAEAWRLNPRIIVVVTDGVAPLPGIVELAECYDTAVMVDNAHASGALGRNGQGTVGYFGLYGRV